MNRQERNIIQPLRDHFRLDFFKGTTLPGVTRQEWKPEEIRNALKWTFKEDMVDMSLLGMRVACTLNTSKTRKVVLTIEAEHHERFERGRIREINLEIKGRRRLRKDKEDALRERFQEVAERLESARLSSRSTGLL